MKHLGSLKKCKQIEFQGIVISTWNWRTRRKRGATRKNAESALHETGTEFDGRIPNLDREKGNSSSRTQENEKRCQVRMALPVDIQGVTSSGGDQLCWACKEDCVTGYFL